MNSDYDIWNILYVHWYKTISQRSKKITNCRYTAEDLAHNTLIKLYIHHETFMTLTLKQQSQYINTILKHEWVDLHRFNRQNMICSDEQLASFIQRSSYDGVDACTGVIETCIESSNGLVGQLFKMRYVEGMRVKDIAKVLGISENKVSVLLHRYLKKERDNISKRLQFSKSERF